MTVKRSDATRGASPPWRRIAAPRRRVATIAATGAVAAGSLAFLLAGCAAAGSTGVGNTGGGSTGVGNTGGGSTGGGSTGPDTTIVRNGEVWLQGQITQDTCDMSKTHVPIGDVGCSITVNGYDVSVVHGNARLSGKPGTVTGLNVSTDQTGRHAVIYAQLTSPHSASILGAPKYYARISA